MQRCAIILGAPIIAIVARGKGTLDETIYVSKLEPWPLDMGILLQLLQAMLEKWEDFITNPPHPVLLKVMY
jgi:hypothetical protein